jgi:branched-chain amino acid transport system ATP-binding protein
VTILVVEQNARVALKYADYGYVLEIGRIVMDDPCAVLREKEDIKEFYLGIKDSRRARHAALEEEEDLEMTDVAA